MEFGPAVLALLTVLLVGCGDDAAPGVDASVGDGGVVDGSDGFADAGMPGRLLWFGPHPDDEFYVAPLVGHYCRDLGWECKLVVFTRGEGGSCNLPEGCVPDLATVRHEEILTSAAVLGAELDHWDLGDNGRFEPYAGDVEEVIALWSSRAGSTEDLVAMVTTAITDFAPTLVLTPDPRHGNYCHPTHRATGALVVSAIQALGTEAPPLQMLASRTARDFEGMGFVPVVTADPTLTFFDGTTRSDTLDAEAWGFYLRVLQAHPSQFPLTDADLATLADVAASNKRVYLADLADATPDDPLYVDLCAPSTFPE